MPPRSSPTVMPCWRHLPNEEVRRRVKDLIRDIEREAAAERRTTEKPVRGADAVTEMDPHYRPVKLDRSPAPDFHARKKKVRKAMRDAQARLPIICTLRRTPHRVGGRGEVSLIESRLSLIESPQS